MKCEACGREDIPAKRRMVSETDAGPRSRMSVKRDIGFTTMGR
jgi:hypothetical protein